MKCTVLFFAQLAEAIGTKRLELELNEGATLGDARAVLAANHDAIARMGDSLALAVNEKYAAQNTTLTDGDTIALIPPVSGG